MRNFATVFGSKLDESILRKAEEKKSCVACDETLNGRTDESTRTHARERNTFTRRAKNNKHFEKTS